MCSLVVAVCAITLLLQPLPASSVNVDAPGSISAWGYNGLHSLGDGTTTSSSSPVAVQLPAGVTASAIAAGGFHNLASTNDGVYTWGGVDVTPVKVAFPAWVTTVTGIAASQSHSMALTNDGLYAWGGNASGQLGDGTNTDSAVPVKVAFPPSVTRVIAIAAGAYHSLAITDDGVYAWGSNGGGQVGDGTQLDRNAPVKVTFPPAVTVTALAGGGFHSLALTDGGIYAWGNNTFGQLGDGTTTTRLEPTKVVFQRRVTPTNVTAVTAGFWHSLAIGDGSIYGWGYNGNGELGDGTSSTRIVPVKAVFGKKTVVTVTAISAGGMHSLALSSTGDVYAFGNNSSGQLGSQGGSRYTPTKVATERNVLDVGAGYYHSLALH